MKKILSFFLPLSFVCVLAQAQPALTDTGAVRNAINTEIVPNANKAITAAKLNRILNGYLNAWPNFSNYTPLSRTLTINGVTQSFGSNMNFTISGTGGSGLTYPYAPRQYHTGWATWATLNSDSLDEGSTRLFFTNARARAALSNGYGLLYDPGTGIFRIDSFAMATRDRLNKVADSLRGLMLTRAGWPAYAVLHADGTGTVTSSTMYYNPTANAFGFGPGDFNAVTSMEMGSGKFNIIVSGWGARLQAGLTNPYDPSKKIIFANASKDWGQFSSLDDGLLGNHYFDLYSGVKFRANTMAGTGQRIATVSDDGTFSPGALVSDLATSANAVLTTNVNQEVEGVKTFRDFYWKRTASTAVMGRLSGYQLNSDHLGSIQLLNSSNGNAVTIQPGGIPTGSGHTMSVPYSTSGNVAYSVTVNGSTYNASQATGNINLGNLATGSYINNQTSQQTSANMNIDGSGYFGKVIVGTQTDAGRQFYVEGTGQVKGNMWFGSSANTFANMRFMNSTDANGYIEYNSNGFDFWTQNVARMRLGLTGALTINNLAGTGERFTVASSTGVLSARAIAATDLPGTISSNTTGTAANVTGTVPLANGGTGGTTAAAARTNLGATTLGSNLFTIANNSTTPKVIQVNADNTTTLVEIETATIDATPTNGSTNAVQSGGVYTALLSKADAALVTSVTSSATLTPTGSAINNKLFVSAQAVNATIAAPSGTPANGNMLLIQIVPTASSLTLTWNAAYVPKAGVTLPTTTTANQSIIVGAMRNQAAGTWEVLSVQ